MNNSLILRTIGNFLILVFLGGVGIVCAGCNSNCDCGGLTIDSKSSLDKAKDCREADGVEVMNVDFTDSVSLPNLVRVVEGLDIRSCPSVKTFSAKRLEFAGGIDITDNPQLESIAGMEGVNGGGDFGIDLTNNPRLKNLVGLSNCTYVEYLGIGGCDSLVNMRGLEGLERVDSGVEIVGNDSLESLDGLETLKKVDGFVMIVGNINLVSIFALGGLQGDAQIYIENNPSLTNLGGFSFLDTLNGIHLKNNTSLNSLDALHAVRTVRSTRVLYSGGDGTREFIRIEDNPALGYCEICDFVAQLDEMPPAEEIYVAGNMSDACGDESAQTYADLTCN